MKLSGIYKIESKIHPSRIYIGSSLNIYSRWNGHTRDLKKGIHHSAKLQNHFNKYNITDLHFSILLECNKEDLIKTEQCFLNTYKPYFNICTVAGNCLGRKCSLETKNKIRNKQKGKKQWYFTKGINLSDEHKANISKSMTGKKRKPLSEELKKKLSIAHKGLIPWNKGRKKLKVA